MQINIVAKIMIKNIKLIVPLSLLLTGCAPTAYQPMGFAGGYTDAHIKDNLYYVEVKTNAYTSSATAAQYFHRRAKEVCLENGYRDYEIRDERNVSSTYTSGSYGGGVATVQSMNKPGFSGYVVCKK